MPNGIYDFQASHVISPSNAVVVVGNTFHYGQNENFLISEYGNDGNLIFKREIDGAASKTDFTTDVTTIGNTIYVTGVEGDTVTGSTFITTIKLDSVGHILWTSKYQNSYKKYNLGFRIIPDPAGSAVYVCGTSQTGPVDFAVTVLKYSTTGTQTWVATYDSVGLYDAAIDMKVSGSNLVVYGISGLSSVSGDIITRSYSLTSGTLVSASRINNTGAYVTRPVAIAKDNAENIYLTGISADAGRMDDIVIIKLDSQLNFKWRKYLDGGNSKSDGVAAIKVDSRNNIILTGWMAKADTSKAIWTIKMRDSVIVWDRKIFCPIAGKDARGADVDLDSRNNIYVTGKTHNGTNFDQLTIAYDSSGKVMWEKTYVNGPTTDDEGRNVKIDSGGNVLVYGRTSAGGAYTYTTAKYEQYTKTNTVVTGATGGKYVNNQLIIHFASSSVKKDSVNQIDINFANPHFFLTDSAYNALAAVVPFDLSQCKMERIYKGLKATYKYSKARNGNMVPIPDFWATFLLIHPAPKSGTELTVANSVNTLWPRVVHTGLNYVGKLTCNPTNATTINDPRFSQQYSLWIDPASGPDSVSIHIDSAWCLETGKRFVKVGIYDSGLQGTHEDFGGYFHNGGDYAFGPKVSGWDFYHNILLGADDSVNGDNFDTPLDPHGTHVAGIIGAIRNNGKGIAGIAGGNYAADTNDVGVSLYGMKVIKELVDTLGSLGNGFDLSMNTLLNAYMVGTTYLPDSGYGFGLHITNNSYGLSPSDSSTPRAPLSYSNMREFELVFKYMFRNLTTSVAAVGNEVGPINYPASFFDDWIISVGASDCLGHQLSTNSPCGYHFWSNTSPTLDILAPGSSVLINSTSWNNSYSSFAGTSAATPHVSGTAALLMSYLDSTAAVYKNLSPEDVSHLLTRNAVDLDVPGRDANTGWGRLNAGRVLQDINKACKELNHYGGRASVPTGTLIKRNVWVKPSEKYTSPSGTTYDTLPRLCWVYRVSDVISHNLGSNYSIEDAWTRPSSTYLLPLYDSTTGILQPFEHLYMDSLNLQSATISGYLYLLVGGDSVTQTGMWGALDSLFLGGNYDTMGFEYTLLLKNNSKNCNTAATEIQEISSHASLSFQPNPVQSRGLLKIYSDMESNTAIDIIDIEGRQVGRVYQGHIATGYTSFDINMTSLAPDIYFICVTLNGDRKVIKISKTTD